MTRRLARLAAFVLIVLPMAFTAVPKRGLSATDLDQLRSNAARLRGRNTVSGSD
jgi:hypothetical protein